MKSLTLELNGSKLPAKWSRGKRLPISCANGAA